MLMRIEVFDRGGQVSEPVRNYVGLRLMSVLDQLVRQVNGVLVSIADVDTSDGEIGKRCRMVALLSPSGAAPVEKTESGLYAAIDRAAEELAHVVADELARREMTTQSLGRVRSAVATLALAPGRGGWARS
jgi:hypothetical protein